ncbi:MAG: hypothetical protein ACRCZ0_10830 [Cetobacterium sp.]
MLKQYIEMTEVFVKSILGTSVEAQRYNKVGTTTNIILVDILAELKEIKEVLAKKPIEETVVSPKSTKSPKSSNK